MEKQQKDNSNKEAYKRLCEERKDMALFLQYDWLEGVCAGHDWDVILVKSKGAEEKAEENAAVTFEQVSKKVHSTPTGSPQETEVQTMVPKAASDSRSIVAAMPYMTEKRLWMRRMQQPELTPYLGIWWAEEVKGDTEEIARICEEFDKALAERHIKTVYRRFPVGSPVPQHLDHHGYRLSTRRTYILHDTRDLDAIMAQFSSNKRQKLEKIQNAYSVEDLDPEDFYRFHVLTCEQKKRHIWYSRELLLVIWEKCRQHNQARLIGVFSEKHELLAAAFMAWDHKTLYQLVNTFDHDTPDNGARELLTFEAINQAHNLGLQLDFVSNRDYLKHYGAERMSYYIANRGASLEVYLEKFLDWLTVR